MLSASERIKSVISHTKMTVRAFSIRIGFDRPQGIYDILSEKTKNISQKMANAICAQWPEIDRYWLITGEGEMLRNAELQKTPAIETKDEALILTGDAKTLVMNMSKTLQLQERNIGLMTENIAQLTALVNKLTGNPSLEVKKSVAL